MFEPAEAEALTSQLRRALELSGEQVGKVNAWLREHLPQAIDVDMMEIQKSSDEMSIPIFPFYYAVSAANSLLLKMMRTSAGLDQVISDLKRLGFDEEQLGKTQHLLSNLTLTEDQAEPILRRRFFSQVGIPTFQDLDLFFDLRPVFAALPSPTSGSQNRARVGRLFGLTPVAIVTIEVEDKAGERSAFVFQLTKAEYKGVMAVFEQGLLQLDAITGQYGKMLI